MKQRTTQPGGLPNMSFLDTFKLLGSLLFLLAIPCGLALLVRDEYLKKHSGFPSYSYTSFANLPTKWEAYENVKAYLGTYKHETVDQDIHLSDVPLWRRPCIDREIAVRALASVINPENGQSTDVTMYFCVTSNREVYAANPEARFYTRH